MKQVPIKLGPLTLLLTVISITLTVLAILTLTTAQADFRLAQKYSETVQVRYDLETQGQEFLCQCDEAYQKGDTSIITALNRDDNGTYWKTIEQDGSRLRIGMTVTDDKYVVVAWKHEKIWAEDDNKGHLWSGS